MQLQSASVKRSVGAVNSPLGALGGAFKGKPVPGSKLRLTKDCKLQVVAPNGKVVWTAKQNTSDLSAKPVVVGTCFLVMRDDADVVLYGQVAGSKASKEAVYSTDSCVYA